MLRLLAFVLPLGLDSFAVAAAIRAAGPVTAGQRLRISVIFVAFEAGMPLIGLTLGSSLARAIGDIADYVAAAAVIGVGAWMLAHGDDDEAGSRPPSGHPRNGHHRARRQHQPGRAGDRVSLGLVRLPLIPVIIAIGVQALLAAQLGLSLGAGSANTSENGPSK